MHITLNSCITCSADCSPIQPTNSEENPLPMKSLSLTLSPTSSAAKERPLASSAGPRVSPASTRHSSRPSERFFTYKLDYVNQKRTMHSPQSILEGIREQASKQPDDVFCPGWSSIGVLPSLWQNTSTSVAFATKRQDTAVVVQTFRFSRSPRTLGTGRQFPLDSVDASKTGAFPNPVWWSSCCRLGPVKKRVGSTEYTAQVS